MTILEPGMLVIAALFVLSFIFGIWLSRLGKPYNVVIFTFHKIIALLLVVFAVITIYNFQKSAEIKTLELIVILSGVIAFLITFVSGALLSIGKPANDSMLIIHKISSILTPVLTAVTVYLLTNN